MTGYLTRRDFLRLTGAAAVLAACGDGGGDGGEGPAKGPGVTFRTPDTKLSGQLRILLWSHFVPAHDTWFDPFAQDWGKRVGVNVVVDHLNQADIPARIAAEIQAKSGHDLIQYLVPLPHLEQSVVDLKDVVEKAEDRHGKQLGLCKNSSFNPTTKKYYSYAPGWAPDPGNYRKSLWTDIGMPDGPKTWDDLLRGGAEIKRSKGIQLGIGMSPELDSNMAGRALLWSYGASIQDKNENVVINSDETIQAVEFMTRLYKEAMTEEVFGWNAASNNQGLVAGQLSYILNSISAWRTAQEANPEVADDVLFVPALTGPKEQRAAEHVIYNWIVPTHAANPDAAKEFLLHYTNNYAAATYHSKLYDFPAFPSLVPDLDAWLDNDPHGAKPANKLAVLKDAVNWSTNIGYPGPANTAEGRVFATFIIPTMFAKAARGQLSPKDSVAEAERAIKAIFAEERAKGLIGGGS